MTADPLETAVGRLLRRVSHWTPPRWAASSTSGAGVGPESGVIRADLVYALVQRLADLAADAEGQPRRGVPRLDSDLSLVDQVRVISADLSRVADAEVRREAATLVDTVHDAL